MISPQRHEERKDCLHSPLRSSCLCGEVGRSLISAVPEFSLCLDAHLFTGKATALHANAKASDPARQARETKANESRFAGFAAPPGSVFCVPSA